MTQTKRGRATVGSQVVVDIQEQLGLFLSLGKSVAVLLIVFLSSVINHSPITYVKLLLSNHIKFGYIIVVSGFGYLNHELILIEEFILQVLLLL